MDNDAFCTIKANLQEDDELKIKTSRCCDPDL